MRQSKRRRRSGRAAAEHHDIKRFSTHQRDSAIENWSEQLLRLLDAERNALRDEGSVSFLLDKVRIIFCPDVQNKTQILPGRGHLIEAVDAAGVKHLLTGGDHWLSGWVGLHLPGFRGSG